MTMMSAMQGPATHFSALHEDRIERLDDVFYIRWTRGPDYVRCFLCIEDGDADMLDFAIVGWKQAMLFREAYLAKHGGVSDAALSKGASS